MADVTIDDKLRDMAEHRGLKLVKSRKRKPGAGDYGKFGLTDAAGKPLLGIGDSGLEASPEDIEAYLRTGAANNWKASADTTLARKPSASRPARDGAEADDGADLVIRPRKRRAAVGRSQDERPARKTPASKTASGEAAMPSRDAARRAKPAAVPADRPVSEPKPELLIRAAKPSDAAALVPLLRQLSGVKTDELGVVRNLKGALKSDAGLVVAELVGIVGCCAWAVIPTIQHGLVGRLTLLLVAEGHRRHGIATALLNTAVTALREASCTQIESMSDIEVKNAHNFFRTLKFEQTSYRFAKAIDDT